MIELKEFDEIVSTNFKYLFDIGFTKVQVERLHAMFYARFIKNDLLVRIEYSIKNDYLNAIIIKNPPTEGDNRDTPENSVGLVHLMSKYQPNFDVNKDYEKLMPKEIGMRHSVEAIAQLFGQYAIDILLGKKWESWGDITGYKSPKSPEINIYYDGEKIKHKPKQD
jgi:hypothetical protein